MPAHARPEDGSGRALRASIGHCLEAGLAAPSLPLLTVLSQLPAAPHIPGHVLPHLVPLEVDMPTKQGVTPRFTAACCRALDSSENIFPHVPAMTNTPNKESITRAGIPEPPKPHVGLHTHHEAPQMVLGGGPESAATDPTFL